jgi:monoamine oxidase
MALTRRQTLRRIAGLAIAPALGPLGCAGNRRDADVIVIGAGLSGLQAAIVLQDAGLDVLVVEGSDRIGGRVYTLDKVPGRPEAGGTEIAPGYARMRNMIQRIGGLPTQRWLETVRMTFAIHVEGQTIAPGDWADSTLNKLPAAERAIPGPMGPFGVPFMYMPRPNPLKDLDSWLGADAAQFDVPYVQFLRDRGASEEALRFTAPWVQAASLDGVSALWQLRTARFNEFIGGIDALERITVGASRVPEGMARLLKREVRMNARVTGLRATADSVTVALADGTQLHGRFAVCAVPLTMLRDIQVEPALPAEQLAAVNSIPYGQALSVFFALKEPFWETDGLPPATWSDGGLGRVFCFSSDSGDYLWMYKTGAAATPYLQMPDAELMARAAAELKQARPASEGRVEPTAVVNWNAHPWTRGHNAYRAPGDTRRFGNRVANPHGRIHFAGEHTAVLMMGMEGAMESGERAAMEILSRA